MSKKITQHKRENNIKTPKNPVKRNKYRKFMKWVFSSSKLRLLRRLSKNRK